MYSDSFSIAGTKGKEVPDWILVTQMHWMEKLEFQIHKLTTLIPVTVTFVLTFYIFIFYTVVSTKLSPIDSEYLFIFLQFYLYPSITSDYSSVSFEAHWTNDAIEIEKQRIRAII